MTLMDEFMKKTEKGLKTLKETAEGFAVNVEKQAKIAAKKVELMRIQKKITQAYAEAGEQVYREHIAGRPIDVDEPYLKERLMSVSRMKAEIRGIEEEIEAIRAESAFKEGPPEQGGA